MNARGLSLVEVLIGAVLIGVSAIPILELVRSGTASLEITEVEAAARQLASDVLERVSGPRTGEDRGLSDLFEKGVLGAPVGWAQVLDADKVLARGFPREQLRSLLETADVRVLVKREAPYPHPVFGKSTDVSAYTVEVSYVDRNDRPKKVKLARLVDE